MTSWAQNAVWWQVYPLGFLGAVPAPAESSSAESSTAESTTAASTEPRSLASLADWFDYLIELGCNALLLGPVFTSESHGYDTVDHFSIDPRLGTEADFDTLIEQAHSRGIRVVLDGVFNHVGRSNPLFQRAIADGASESDRSWFRFSDPADPTHADSFEGHDALVAFNLDSPDVQGYVADAMTHWLERGADGWRLDAAYTMPAGFWTTVLPGVRERFSDAWFVGEMIHGDYAGYVAESGLDSVTQYELWKAIFNSLNEGNLFELAHSLTRHNEFSASFLPQTFIGNHDVTRIASAISDERHHSHALALLLMVPGTPSIYYGDEQGFRGVKEDRAGGDDEIRPAFPPVPGDLAPWGEPVHRLHQRLIAMRRRHAWLATATVEVRALTNESAQIVARDASSGSEATLSLNLGDTPVRFESTDGQPIVEIVRSSGVDDSGLDPSAGAALRTLDLGPHEWTITA
jgi:cyclomaltodextrinase